MVYCVLRTNSIWKSCPGKIWESILQTPDTELERCIWLLNWSIRFPEASSHTLSGGLVVKKPFLWKGNIKKGPNYTRSRLKISSSTYDGAIDPHFQIINIGDVWEGYNSEYLQSSVNKLQPLWVIIIGSCNYMFNNHIPVFLIRAPEKSSCREK